MTACLQDAVPLHKVTIIPRGHSLGHTAFLPEKDNIQVTRSQMLAQLDVLMGGRAAEELILGLDKITTGASDGGDPIESRFHVASSSTPPFPLQISGRLQNWS